MRRVKIESVEDLDALPEGEWVHVPEGIKADWSYEGFEVTGKGLDITLPTSVAKQLRSLRGKRLRATLKGRHLIVEK